MGEITLHVSSNTFNFIRKWIRCLCKTHFSLQGDCKIDKAENANLCLSEEYRSKYAIHVCVLKIFNLIWESHIGYTCLNRNSVHLWILIVNDYYIYRVRNLIP